jgi:hypothetical protein
LPDDDEVDYESFKLFHVDLIVDGELAGYQ